VTWHLNAGATEFVPSGTAWDTNACTGTPLPAAPTPCVASEEQGSGSDGFAVGQPPDEWTPYWWGPTGTIDATGNPIIVAPGVQLPMPPPEVPDFESRGLGQDSPRAALLTLCGAWGALATRKPLVRSTLLEFHHLVPRSMPVPEELQNLKCVAMS